MREQDVELGQLSVSVVRLGEMGRTINQELKAQGAALDELDAEARPRTRPTCTTRASPHAAARTLLLNTLSLPH